MLDPLLKKGDGHAHALAGLLHEFGNEAQAPDYFAARSAYDFAVRSVGSLDAWLGLARLHLVGKGMAVDIDRAHELYSVILDDSGHPLALINLARMYIDPGCDKYNPELAMDYLSQARSLGYVAAYALLAKLHRELGSPMRALGLRVLGILRASWYVLRDKDDPRLMGM